jgi:hypothetical protein
VAAHGAEVGVDLEVLVVERPRRLAVERELELPRPVERRAGAGQVVVPGARARDATGDVTGVRGDAVGDAAGLHVLGAREPDVLLRRHVAEHGGARAGRFGGTDRARDVVVAGKGVGHERTENVERRVVADLLLALHVPGDLVEGDVAGTLDHGLHARRPRALHELAERRELGELRGVARVGEAARAEPVAERVGDVVLAHDGADRVEELVHRILAAVVDHPLGEDRAAARDDAREARPDERQMPAQHPGVDGEVVDALLRLALDLPQDDVVSEVLDAPAEDHAVDRHGADGDRRVIDDRLAAGREVAARREVHQRVGAVALRPLELLDLGRRPLATGEAPMLALTLVVIMRPMPIGSRRRGARSPRSGAASPIAAARCATVWFTQ